ncbi:MAG TPA: DUF977 family protein [Rhizomicrobium sp.]|nr:DUF977 family protein [Rhizomicrobium sp.]
MGVIGCRIGHSVRIIDQAREHGRVTIGQMARLTGVSRNTLKAHFRLLVENGHLALHGKTRGAWYTLRHHPLSPILGERAGVRGW